MNKPDWKDAPEWARYLAQDRDGTWFWFEKEPIAGPSEWVLSGGRFEEANAFIYEWEGTLEAKQIDWSKVAVDTKLLVRNDRGADWNCRYFAKFENGKVYAWNEGATSWSARSKEHINPWLSAKLYDEWDEPIDNPQKS